MSSPAARPTSDGRPAASGQLAERPIARLLHQLMRKRITGTLVVTDEAGDESRVFLREGAPVHLVRPTDVDRLDHVVTEAGLVAPEVMAAVAASLPSGKRLGEVLIERGLVAEATLADLLKLQMRRKLFKLFFVRKGRYAIYLDAHGFGAGDEFREMRVDPRCLVFDGIRAAYDESRLRTELAPLAGRRFRLLRSVPASLLEAMGFPPGDPTLALLDGPPRALGDFPPRGSAAAPSLTVVLALLYADLLEAEVAGAAAPAPAPPAAAANPAPSPAGAARAPADDQALAARIEAQLAAAETASHFELLGVSPSASNDEIGAAYLKLMREFHPDRIAGRGLRALATRAAALVARINEANAVLQDPKRKAAYLADLEAARSGQPSPADFARTLMNAEVAFQKGEVHLRKNDFAAATEAFTAAVQGNDKEPIYRAYAAWARWQAAPGPERDRTARDTLTLLISVGAERAKFALGRYWQGLLYKHIGDFTAAESAFRGALGEDKNLLDAQRELRVLEMRRQNAAANPPASDKAPSSAARPKSALDKLLKR